MNGDPAYQDTYYVVLHSWWVLVSLALLVCVVAILLAIRRRSASTRARRLSGYALWTLIAGQLLGTGAAFGAYFAAAKLLPWPLVWALGGLNLALGVGMVLTVLALLLTAIALVFAVRDRSKGQD